MILLLLAALIQERTHSILLIKSVSNINDSINACYSSSGIYSKSCSVAETITCLISYSTFANNTSHQYACISMNSVNTNEMLMCNVISNSQQARKNYGIILSHGNTNIKNSCILNNCVDYVFYQSSSYKLIVTNCTLEEDYSSSNQIGSVSVETASNTFINKLQHIELGYCKAARVITSRNKRLALSCNRLNNCASHVHDHYTLMLIITFSC